MHHGLKLPGASTREQATGRPTTHPQASTSSAQTKRQAMLMVSPRAQTRRNGAGSSGSGGCFKQVLHNPCPNQRQGTWRKLTAASPLH
mmetsp:Transcript_77728/g.207647  ORF Transcript_77728/g.207647 Transcript_77728/m.207647 type:complete len:88 (-) Transcript_77728:453-716(-)